MSSDQCDTTKRSKMNVMISGKLRNRPRPKSTFKKTLAFKPVMIGKSSDTLRWSNLALVANIATESVVVLFPVVRGNIRDPGIGNVVD